MESKIDSCLVLALVAVISFSFGRAGHVEASAVAIAAPPPPTERAGTPGAFAKAQDDLDAEEQQENSRIKQQFIWERLGTLEEKVKETEARCCCNGKCCGR